MLLRRNSQVLLGIIILTILAVTVVFTDPLRVDFLGVTRGGTGSPLGMVLGLDLRGGTHIVYEAVREPGSPAITPEQIHGVVNIIERRVNAYGVAEPIVQQMGDDRVLVELPGVKNIDEAKNLIGKTAQLEFKEQQTVDGKTDWAPAKAELNGQQIALTGRYLKPNSQVTLDPQTGLPLVHFEWNDDGAKLFEQITSRLVGKPLGIFLDNQRISSPTVRAIIRDQGVIEGMALDEARLLSIQLNAGALPVPVRVIQEQDIDATLGADSLQRSLVAGYIGLGLVLLFMIIYYRVPGFLAGMALVVYTFLNMALFKLFPVTLTLTGIAAFILSIGMAVDANILIFERMKEELRAGRTLAAAIEAGFSRAWPSIRDSNLSTMITCVILYWFGDKLGAPVVKGFALTLFIGVAVSMFSAVFITRVFMRAIARTALMRAAALFSRA